VRRTVPPSAEIEAQIEQLLAVGVGENPRESLSELAKLGARLIIQRAVEDEFDAWLGRARYERRPDYQRGLRNYESGLRNGFRPRKVQTAEGELEVEIPQVREAAETFASKLFPRGTKLVRTEPLKALVIGAFVRGLSMRDVESLCEKAGLGKLSKSTVSRVCEELRERYAAFRGVSEDLCRHERKRASCLRERTAGSGWRSRGVAPASSGASPEGERGETPAARARRGRCRSGRCRARLGSAWRASCWIRRAGVRPGFGMSWSRRRSGGCGWACRSGSCRPRCASG
jgi:Transposase, Mutator family